MAVSALVVFGLALRAAGTSGACSEPSTLNTFLNHRDFGPGRRLGKEMAEQHDNDARRSEQLAGARQTRTRRSSRGASWSTGARQHRLPVPDEHRPGGAQSSGR